MSLVLQWDMFGYLACLQLLLLGYVLRKEVDGTNSKEVNREICLVFSVAVFIFWLVWGGYSTDAWRYLSRFEHNPFGFQEEQLFWLLGNSLHKLVPNPWPLKILSAISIIILTYAFYRYHNEKKGSQLAISYMLLLATPGFFLLIGNVIRQGIAGAIAILGVVIFLQGGYWRWAALAIPSFLIHQYSILIFLAIPVARIFKKHVLWIWLLSPFCIPVVNQIFSIFGINIGNPLSYISYTEGEYHWEKFIVSSGVSLLVLFSIWRKSDSYIDFRHVYIILVGISNIFVIYEVPYERLLLFSDLAAPIAISQVITLETPETNRLKAVSVLCIAAAMILWSSPSIIKSLGIPVGVY